MAKRKKGDDDANTERQKVKQGRPSGFLTTGMEEAIQDTYTEHREWVEARLDRLTADSEEYTTWKKGKAAALLEEAAFAGCVVDGDVARSRNAWINRIVRKYSDIFRRDFKKRIKHSTATDIPPELAKSLGTAWLSAIGSLKPRQLFIEENSELIKAVEKRLVAEGCTAAQGGGIHNKAAAIAWNDCSDQAHWEQRAQDPTAHTDQFREFFPVLFQEAKAGLLERKVLGTVVIKSFISMRDDNGNISTLIGAQLDVPA
ncbi:hypothetical protein NMY22_g19913 [Coprinellus aureogranulatus]|nr:hypothetical protein NMY22_g19913 [Coprinellus aureogranulatus]